MGEGDKRGQREGRVSRLIKFITNHSVTGKK
jgi:hypothetical protein